MGKNIPASPSPTASVSLHTTEAFFSEALALQALQAHREQRELQAHHKHRELQALQAEQASCLVVGAKEVEVEVVALASTVLQQAEPLQVQ